MFIFQFNKDRPLPSTPENALDFEIKAYYYYIDDFQLKGEQGRKKVYIELTPKQYEDCKEKSKKFDGSQDDDKLYDEVMKLVERGEAKVAKGARELKSIKTGDVIRVTESIVKDKKTGKEFRYPDNPQFENEHKMRFRMFIEQPGKRYLECPCIPQLETPVYYVMAAKGKQIAGAIDKKPSRRNIT